MIRGMLLMALIILTVKGTVYSIQNYSNSKKNNIDSLQLRIEQNIEKLRQSKSKFKALTSSLYSEVGQISKTINDRQKDEQKKVLRRQSQAIRIAMRELKDQVVNIEVLKATLARDLQELQKGLGLSVEKEPKQTRNKIFKQCNNPALQETPGLVHINNQRIVPTQ